LIKALVLPHDLLLLILLLSEALLCPWACCCCKPWGPYRPLHLLLRC
jgi:hypothetical protein